MTTVSDALRQYGGQPVGGFMKDGSAAGVYFVDGNSGLDSNDGLSWDKAFQTFAKAVTISNISIAASANKWWARRNTIFLAGDRLVEDIVIFPNKCDVIGVGSCDSFKGACLEGDHAPTAGTGTRFYNMGFEPGTAADMFTFATGTVSGIEFHNCEFRSTRSGATAVSAIDITNCVGLKLFGNLFRGAFSGDVIDIGAGAVNHFEIIGNKILGGANDGIVVTGTTTITGGQMGIISGNSIYVNNITISDGADSTFLVSENICVTPAAYGGTSHVITVEFAANNYVTADGASYRIPVITDIEV